MHTEHKSFSEKKPQQLVYLELGVGNGGMMLSLSEDGFRFRAVTPVRANGTLPFAFALDGTHRMEGSGVIEWVEEDGKSGGLRFTEVSQEFRSALSAWLSSDSSGQMASREVTPAAAVPLDTMEKIRQELRSGYPARPAVEPAAEPKIPVGTPDPAITEPKPQRVTTERKSDPVPDERKWPQPCSEQEPESKESQVSSRLFPSATPNLPEPEPPTVAASAFLKPPMARNPAPAAPVPTIKPKAPKFSAAVLETPVAPPALRKMEFTLPAPTIKPAAPKFPAVAPAIPAASPSASDSEPSRPFVPAFEESFEYAWERAKLTAPADSARVSRAAAGGIITIALGAILGVLAFNYRQDIGSLIVQVGHSISGDDHSALPASSSPPAPVQESNPAGQPSNEQKAADKQERPATSLPATTGNSSNAGNPPSALSSAKPAGPQTDATIIGKASPPAAAARQSPIPAPASTLTPKDSGVGQEEFDAAREILRGNNRQRDMSKAVDLLWSGVRKGFVPAEVTLADLFRRGDGVEKNCDQARVLLVAASKKGSTDARQMLEQVAEQGCQ
jgi:hypothetical protein